MTSAKHATSRPASVRGASAVREIAKKRDKPYKTERKRVLARKRKLDLHTSYTKAPKGYTFLPVGTPDLAERCKELSRQKAYPVNVVNAKPFTRNAIDPEKVSHHIHRIGYHFFADIVVDACEQLGYTMFQGQFIKEVDLEKQHRDSLVAQTLAKYGVSMDALQSNHQRETPDQVRAAIKELFPKIPENDLYEIVRHAWEEGTSRVGTNESLDLPRRVQLATIARIRHAHTDYDRLLRAFEWRDARIMVEKDCLETLISWRGEIQDEEDNELEEIVRETIVIDDDDDEGEVMNYGHDADDEDSATEPEAGHMSDTSIEITHHVATEDLGAESFDERARRYVNRLQPWRRREVRDVELRSTIARQKIGAARQRIRDEVPRTEHTPQSSHLPEILTSVGNVTPAHIEHGSLGRYRDEVILNGLRYRLAPAQQSSTAYRYLPSPRDDSLSQVPVDYTKAVPMRPSSIRQRPEAPPLYDHPLVSIERDDLSQRATSHRQGMYSDERLSASGLPPMTPDSERPREQSRPEQRAVAPYLVDDRFSSAYSGELLYPQDNRHAHASRASTGVVNLRPPPRQQLSRPADPLATHTVSMKSYGNGERHAPIRDDAFGSVSHMQPLANPDSVDNKPTWIDNVSIPYDIPQPTQHLPELIRDQSSRVLRPETSQNPVYVNLQPVPRLYNIPPPHDNTRSSVTQVPYLQVYQNPQPSVKYTAPPVHGAPAPVQQVPRQATQILYRVPHGGDGASRHLLEQAHPTLLQRPPPVDGAVAPTQYHHSR